MFLRIAPKLCCSHSLTMMRCLPPCPAGHIIAEGNIMRGAHIICPTGETSLKKARFRVLFLAPSVGLEPTTLRLTVVCSSRLIALSASDKPIFTGFFGLCEVNGQAKCPFIFYSTFQSG